MPDLELSRRWRRAAPALATELRVPYLRAELLAYPIVIAANALERICGDAEQGVPDAREVLVSLVDLLNQADFGAPAEALREEAMRSSLLALGRLLRRPSPQQSRRPSVLPRSERVPDYGKGRELTLGERKSLARRPSRQMLEQLLSDPDPSVIRLLLGNPRVTEEDIVRLAARRPNRPEVLAEIAQSARFAHRSRVRLALVLNPSSPPEIAVPFVGLLLRSELRLVTTSTDAPPIVRNAARDLLMRRPPMKKPRSGEEPGEIQ